MAITSRFAFVGDLYVPKSTSKKPLLKEMTIERQSKKVPALSMNFGVKASDTNMAFVECFDSKQDVIKTMSTENEKIEIDWDDRKDEDVVATVASYRKYVIDLGEDYGGRQEFVAAYDFMLALKEIFKTYKGRVTATGQYTKEWYEGQNGGQYYDHFKLQGVYAPAEDRKNRLALTMDVYYNRDSVDDTDWKSEKKILLNGYVQQYINKDEGNKFILNTFVFNGAKYDPDNEKHQQLLDYKLSYIKTKSKTMVHIPWDIVLLRGAEEAEFTEDMLTDAQRVQVELGIKKVEDFKPRGKVIGNNINEYRLFDPRLTGDFVDGLVDTNLSFAEFEEQIYQPAADEKLDDVVKSATKKTTKTAGKAVDVTADDFDDGDDTTEDDLF